MLVHKEALIAAMDIILMSGIQTLARQLQHLYTSRTSPIHIKKDLHMTALMKRISFVIHIIASLSHMSINHPQFEVRKYVFMKYP